MDTNNNNVGLEIAKETIKEVAKDVYVDAGKPIVQPTGELVGLVPRAIKAALSPLEKWILQKEYNVAETKKMLEEKLQNIPPELIESPEPHIAVPAMQYISYCMDCDELRDMYANLLANSMNKVVKNGVHPGFVEIIKQLCPDEAKILRYLSKNPTIPIITLRYVKEDGSSIDVVKNFSNIGELTDCEKPYEINKYFNNLNRLGLIEYGHMASLTNKDFYTPLKENPYIIRQNQESLAKAHGFKKTKIKEGYIDITKFGESFCNICLGDTKTIITHQSP